MSAGVDGEHFDLGDLLGKAADAVGVLADGAAGCGCAAVVIAPEARIASTELQAAGDAIEDASAVSKGAALQASGAQREATGMSKLAAANPGAKIQPQAYLRDANGTIVKDPVTGTARKVDAAIIKNGKASTVEITSPTANKAAQAAKEQRIIDKGGTYVRDGRGRKAPLVPVDGPSKRMNVP